MRLFWLIVCFCAPLAGAAHAGSRQRVGEIRVQGNSRTAAEVIAGEMTLRAGGDFGERAWNDDVQAVKDMGIFWGVDATSVTRPDRSRDLYVTVREKWTVLPIIQYDQTSDAFQWTLGAWDANFLGRHVETGVQVTRKRASTGLDVWTKNPRIGASPYYFSTRLFLGDEQYAVYDAFAPGDRAESYYSGAKRSVSVEFGRRFDPKGYLRAGALFAPYATTYALLSNTPEQRIANSTSAFAPPAARTANVFGLRGSWGRLHYDDYVYEGRRMSALGTYTLPASGGDKPFAALEAEFQWHWVPAARQSVVARLFGGYSQSKRIEDGYWLGGLKEIRGFPDQRFHGSKAAYANLEYRYPALDNRYVLVQAAPLFDAGSAWDETPGPLAVAAGAGIRFLLKPVHKAIIRLDAVKAIAPYARTEYSLGFTQFIEEDPAW